MFTCGQKLKGNHRILQLMVIFFKNYKHNPMDAILPLFTQKFQGNKTLWKLISEIKIVQELYLCIR